MGGDAHRLETGKVTAGLAKSNGSLYRRVDDFKSPAGWLPVHRDQLRAQRSANSMGNFIFYLNNYSSVS